jgi:hypothetical protein
MMQWRVYKNEILVGLALLLLVIAFFYKQGELSAQNGGQSAAVTSLQELKEVIALKKVWGDKKITKKVDALKTMVPANQVKWKRNGKKLTATFSKLNPNLLNKMTTKVMNIAVEIQKLEVKKSGGTYQMELKCKW